MACRLGTPMQMFPVPVFLESAKGRSCAGAERRPSCPACVTCGNAQPHCWGTGQLRVPTSSLRSFALCSLRAHTREPGPSPAQSGIFFAQYEHCPFFFSFLTQKGQMAGIMGGDRGLSTPVVTEGLGQRPETLGGWPYCPEIPSTLLSSCHLPGPHDCPAAPGRLGAGSRPPLKAHRFLQHLRGLTCGGPPRQYLTSDSRDQLIRHTLPDHLRHTWCSPRAPDSHILCVVCLPTARSLRPFPRPLSSPAGRSPSGPHMVSSPLFTFSFPSPHLR